MKIENFLSSMKIVGVTGFRGLWVRVTGLGGLWALEWAWQSTEMNLCMPKFSIAAFTVSKRPQAQKKR